MSGIVCSAASFGRYQSWAATHCGAVRTLNEDAFVNRPELGLWAVADGAGGHQSGDVASRAISETLITIPAGLPAQDLLTEVRTRLEATHLGLRDQAAASGPGMVVASTVVVLLMQGDHFACLWAGDSRAYLLRGGTLTRISRDHSVVEDLVESGIVSADEAGQHRQANVITRAVGAGVDALVLDKRTGPILPGDRLLLCSDGLTKALHDAQITRLLDADEDAGAERLVLAALSASATDNVTAVTILVMPAA